ncbi:nucleoside hydrolase [Enterocloster citroniae]|uniref:nucleoside hydrolase n=1 Tax=Enterocloster citroniae TaxID=358743 RepID=UPI001897AC13|nr:nucleoside hydrolase [Enterocloster citroniae]
MVYNNYHFRIPEGKMVRLIVNTDAKNEADDQYAIVHALLSPKFDNRGIIAAHFGNEKSPHSMEDSYDEVLKMLDLMDFPRDLAYKGADRRLPDEKTPVESQGARLIIEEAMKESDMPLYVIFLGPLTDMASAYLMEPRIAGRLTCIWIGGGKYPEGGYEYNLNNDIRSARVVMNSDMPVWQIPRNVYSQVIVSLAELEYKVRPCGELGRYLFDQLEEHGHTSFAKATTRTGEYWCLGDSPAVGVLLFAHMFDYDWVQAPLITDNMTYAKNSQNRPIRVYNRVDHRFILEDFYAKLALFTNK